MNISTENNQASPFSLSILVFHAVCAQNTDFFSFFYFFFLFMGCSSTRATELFLGLSLVEGYHPKSEKPPKAANNFP
jgi:hypothetical protein